MADINGRRPRLVGPDGAPVSAETALNVGSELGVLRRQVAQLQSVVRDLHETAKVHQTALLDLAAVVQGFEERTLRGRIRRARAWGALQWEGLRAYGIELGLIKIPLAVPVLPDAPRPDLDNPEAMPKRPK